MSSTMIVGGAFATFQGNATGGIFLTVNPPVVPSVTWIGHIITCRAPGIVVAGTTVIGLSPFTPPGVELSNAVLSTATNVVFDVH